jgi:hypothetical protein
MATERKSFPLKQLFIGTASIPLWSIYFLHQGTPRKLVVYSALGAFVILIAVLQVARRRRSGGAKREV